MLSHEFDDFKVFSSLEESGYGNLQPAILPHQLEELCKGEPRLENNLASMFGYINRYAHDVYSMMIEQIELSDKRERGEDTNDDFQELKHTDERRHQLHDALIDSINLLSRELAKAGKDNEWMHDFVHEGRAGYARFALLTFYKLHVTMK